MSDKYYYFSKSNKVEGPVGLIIIQSMFDHKLLDSSSKVCREGNDEWINISNILKKAPTAKSQAKVKDVMPRQFNLTFAAIAVVAFILIAAIATPVLYFSFLEPTSVFKRKAQSMEGLKYEYKWGENQSSLFVFSEIEYEMETKKLSSSTYKATMTGKLTDPSDEQIFSFSALVDYKGNKWQVTDEIKCKMISGEPLDQIRRFESNRAMALEKVEQNPQIAAELAEQFINTLKPLRESAEFAQIYVSVRELRASQCVNGGLQEQFD